MIGERIASCWRGLSQAFASLAAVFVEKSFSICTTYIRTYIIITGRNIIRGIFRLDAGTSSFNWLGRREARGFRKDLGAC